MVDIPIFLINRNRLTTTRRLAKWLLNAGNKRVTIIDNDSTYPPLLEYYRNLPDGIDVRYMNSNTGPGIFWDSKMHLELNTPYIVSDSDLIPADFCPTDVVQHLARLLNKYQEFSKIGVGLRIDNIPDDMPWKNTPTIQWQNEYWKNRYSSECFRAAVDTTFAIYRKDNVDSMPHNSLRTDAPYVFEHVPWYIWPLNEEEQYYHEHSTYWSSISLWKKEYGHLAGIGV